MADVLKSRSELTTATPMMKQYLEIKEQYEDYVLMYRLGDFYECFFEDAITASRELELTLTSRDCGEGKRAAMCGVPFHKSDVYVGRLVEKGIKVAICEQIGDPKHSDGLVKREVIRVVTPGTITDNSLLNEEQNNYLCAICYGAAKGASVAFADISTGEVSVTFIDEEDTEARIANELAAYQPAEIIINVDEKDCSATVKFIRERFPALIGVSQGKLFDYGRAKDMIRSSFRGEYEKLTEPEMIMAVGALLEYILETQKSQISFAKEINVYTKGMYVELDANTRRNLELVESMRTKKKSGSLLGVLDKTKTAMGARLLRTWILRPLLNPALISRRQASVSDFIKNPDANEDIAELLSQMLDLERLTAKTVYGTANAKDLKAICQSIEVLPRIKQIISSFGSDAVREIYREIDVLDDLAELLSAAIIDNPPFSVREGGMIKPGFDSEVDYYRGIKENGASIMQSIEEREREATGIRTLKVNYNKVFGYYIEVSKSFINDVPERFIRKQTLTNCERYITQELKEMETAILSAEEKIVTLEYELFMKLRTVVSENSDRIRKTAELIASIDVFRSFAEVASKNSYVCPEVDLSDEIFIKDGRHPVVEKYVNGSYFVPNDTQISNSGDRVMIITGPNMAGKSTYMRQVAIITVMAQIGSFVPAREAKIGIVDKVFTRVGASDDLASGQSTFMLEMSEVANILKNATQRSLIIYDEVGRGTSTYDGMAIAKAVVEYTHSKKIGAKTLFATHYHELISMESEFPGIVNYNIAAKKRGDSITFLRKIVRGGTDDSYGIEVAKLAGVPSEVVKRARELLKEIESGGFTPKVHSTEKRDNEFDLLSGLISVSEGEVIEKIKSTDINTLTPIEAMNLLFELKKTIS